MIRAFILICIFLGLTEKISAQSKGITPMHTFFQKYADSTIILEYNTDSYDPNYYFILTKTGDTINSFRYLAKMKFEQALMPKMMKLAISMEKSKDFNDLASINANLNVVNLNRDTLRTIWTRATGLNVWKIIEDNSPPACANPKKVAVTSHCGEIIVHRITKTMIQSLIFHCPWSDNERCPDNYNRIGAIAIDKLFRVYFPDMYN